MLKTWSKTLGFYPREINLCCVLCFQANFFMIKWKVNDRIVCSSSIGSSIWSFYVFIRNVSWCLHTNSLYFVIRLNICVYLRKVFDFNVFLIYLFPRDMRTTWHVSIATKCFITTCYDCVSKTGVCSATGTLICFGRERGYLAPPITRVNICTQFANRIVSKKHCLIITSTNTRKLWRSKSVNRICFSSYSN